MSAAGPLRPCSLNTILSPAAWVSTLLARFRENSYPQNKNSSRDYSRNKRSKEEEHAAVLAGVGGDRDVCRAAGGSLHSTSINRWSEAPFSASSKWSEPGDAGGRRRQSAGAQGDGGYVGVGGAGFARGQCAACVRAGCCDDATSSRKDRQEGVRRRHQLALFRVHAGGELLRMLVTLRAPVHPPARRPYGRSGWFHVCSWPLGFRPPGRPRRRAPV